MAGYLREVAPYSDDGKNDQASRLGRSMRSSYPTELNFRGVHATDSDEEGLIHQA